MSQARSLSQELLHKIVLDGWPRDQRVRAIMADFVDVARRLTDSDYGSIYVIEKEDDELRVVSAHAAFQDRAHVEFLPDGPDVLADALIREAGGPGGLSRLLQFRSPEG